MTHAHSLPTSFDHRLLLMARKSIFPLLLASLACLVECRHTAGPVGAPLWRQDPSDPTVNSKPSVPMFGRAGADSSDLLYVDQRSPTTQLVSFSPDRIAISVKNLIGEYAADPTIKFNRTIHKVVLFQRSCLIRPGDSYDKCLVRPWGARDEVDPAASRDLEHEFFRLGGLGGLSIKEAAYRASTVQNDPRFAGKVGKKMRPLGVCAGLLLLRYRTHVQQSWI